jgi:hypothetical protein
VLRFRRASSPQCGFRRTRSWKRHVLPIARLVQNTLLDESSYHGFTRRRVQLPQPTCLSERQSQTGHLVIFADDTTQKRL